ncbi:MAG: hypothetical protein WC069_01065 [Candidatus Shapirobacteria bacterium]
MSFKRDALLFFSGSITTAVIGSFVYFDGPDFASRVTEQGWKNAVNDYQENNCLPTERGKPLPPDLSGVTSGSHPNENDVFVSRTMSTGSEQPMAAYIYLNAGTRPPTESLYIVERDSACRGELITDQVLTATDLDIMNFENNTIMMSQNSKDCTYTVGSRFCLPK